MAEEGESHGHGEDKTLEDKAQISAEELLSKLGLAQSRPVGDGKEFKFWSTQPVLKLDESTEEHGPIDAIKTPDDVRSEPYAMPAGFEWSDVDVTDDAQLHEVYVLLAENYVEDDDSMFRFDYPVPFLKWALLPPGYNPAFHIGVRSTKTKKLLGFITGIPVLARVYSEKVKMVEINFLCVHKKLRSKRLAPVLIKEVTRRVNKTDVWQAVYTAGVVLPKPVASCRYWHRSLNPKKLVEVGFSRLPPRMTMNMLIKLYKLPATPATPGIRKLTAEDVPSACKLLNSFLDGYDLVTIFSEEEFAHWFLPRDHVVDCYVRTDDKTGEVTDICSYYHLPSTVLRHEKYKSVNAAYSFYNVATTVSPTELIQDLLVLAKNNGFDVFNALDVQKNSEVFGKLKFGIGDGHLQYYLYNWKCPAMTPPRVGLVLL